MYDENYACCRAYTLPARSNHSDSAHFACPGMQNGSFLVFGHSSNVRKCSSELGICGRLTRCLFILGGHGQVPANMYDENYACCRAYTLPARSNHSDSAHFACPGMQNGSFLVFGLSSNVRKCSSELGICGRLTRCFHHTLGRGVSKWYNKAHQSLFIGKACSHE